MTSRKLPQIVVSVLFVLVFSARADVRLPALFADDMVLQQEMQAPVWGWADEGEEVAAFGEAGSGDPSRRDGLSSAQRASPCRGFNQAPANLTHHEFLLATEH